MVGHLHFLWWWCMDYALDGDLSKYTPEQIADAAEWDNDPNVFINALIQSGFIDSDNKSMKIHDWMEFCGELVIKRLDRRKVKRQKTADNNRRNPPKSAEMPPTVPYQTIPNQKTTPFRFEEIWDNYPNKDGRKAALRSFEASVKTTEDFEDIQKALKNYLSSDRVSKGFIKNGATWFNNWRDWIVPPIAQKKEEPAWDQVNLSISKTN